MRAMTMMAMTTIMTAMTMRAMPTMAMTMATTTTTAMTMIITAITDDYGDDDGNVSDDNYNKKEDDRDCTNTLILEEIV